VEPFGETGTMVDPHSYLNLLGRIADQFGLSPLAVYNFAGLGLQVLLVGGLSIGFALITQRWWAAYFGVSPHLTRSSHHSDLVSPHHSHLTASLRQN
jgi:hypothetical protein